MSSQIGFVKTQNEEKVVKSGTEGCVSVAKPRRSVVQVHFAARNITCSYYNDCFDLKRGDLVYVDGKLEGYQGCVVDVNYNFKIKVSEYKRVIAVADTSVIGELFLAGSHLVAFDPQTLPVEKIETWFLPPKNPEDEIVCGSDDSVIFLGTMGGMNISSIIGERGHNYYMENRVRYLCVDGCQGYAIVEGSKPYEVEFEYQDGEISNLTCSCFCNYHCKHEVAAMLQLRETLERIEKQYKEIYQETEYFAVIYAATLFSMAVSGKEKGSISFSC